MKSHKRSVSQSLFSQCRRQNWMKLVPPTPSKAATSVFWANQEKQQEKKPSYKTTTTQQPILLCQCTTQQQRRCFSFSFQNIKNAFHVEQKEQKEQEQESEINESLLATRRKLLARNFAAKKGGEEGNGTSDQRIMDDKTTPVESQKNTAASEPEELNPSSSLSSENNNNARSETEKTVRSEDAVHSTSATPSHRDFPLVFSSFPSIPQEEAPLEESSNGNVKKEEIPNNGEDLSPPTTSSNFVSHNVQDETKDADLENKSMPFNHQVSPPTLSSVNSRELLQVSESDANTGDEAERRRKEEKSEEKSADDDERKCNDAAADKEEEKALLREKFDLDDEEDSCGSDEQPQYDSEDPRTTSNSTAAANETQQEDEKTLSCADEEKVTNLEKQEMHEPQHPSSSVCTNFSAEYSSNAPIIDDPVGVNSSLSAEQEVFSETGNNNNEIYHHQQEKMGGAAAENPSTTSFQYPQGNESTANVFPLEEEKSTTTHQCPPSIAANIYSAVHPSSSTDPFSFSNDGDNVQVPANLHPHAKSNFPNEQEAEGVKPQANITNKSQPQPKKSFDFLFEDDVSMTDLAVDALMRYMPTQWADMDILMSHWIPASTQKEIVGLCNTSTFINAVDKLDYAFELKRHGMKKSSSTSFADDAEVYVRVHPSFAHSEKGKVDEKVRELTEKVKAERDAQLLKSAPLPLLKPELAAATTKNLDFLSSASPCPSPLTADCNSIDEGNLAATSPYYPLPPTKLKEKPRQHEDVEITPVWGSNCNAAPTMSSSPHKSSTTSAGFSASTTQQSVTSPASMIQSQVTHQGGISNSPVFHQQHSYSSLSQASAHQTAAVPSSSASPYPSHPHQQPVFQQPYPSPHQPHDPAVSLFGAGGQQQQQPPAQQFSQFGTMDNASPQFVPSYPNPHQNVQPMMTATAAEGGGYHTVQSAQPTHTPPGAPLLHPLMHALEMPETPPTLTRAPRSYIKKQQNGKSFPQIEHPVFQSPVIEKINVSLESIIAWHNHYLPLLISHCSRRVNVPILSQPGGPMQQQQQFILTSPQKSASRAFECHMDTTIHIISTWKEAEEAGRELTHYLQAQRNNYIGLDLEWPWNNHPALLQLATRHDVYLFRLRRLVTVEELQKGREEMGQNPMQEGEGGNAVNNNCTAQPERGDRSCGATRNEGNGSSDSASVAEILEDGESDTNLDSFFPGDMVTVILKLPRSIQAILADPAIIKSTVDIEQDAAKMKTEFNVDVRGCVDLHHLMLFVGYPIGAKCGLQHFGQRLCSTLLDKDPRVRRSNWEKTQLTDDQVMYAANDARMSFWLMAGVLDAYGLKNNEEAILRFVHPVVDVKKKAENARLAEEFAQKEKNAMGGKKFLLPPPKRSIVLHALTSRNLLLRLVMLLHEHAVSKLPSIHTIWDKYSKNSRRLVVFQELLKKLGPYERHLLPQFPCPDCELPNMVPDGILNPPVHPPKNNPDMISSRTPDGDAVLNSNLPCPQVGGAGPSMQQQPTHTPCPSVEGTSEASSAPPQGQSSVGGTNYYNEGKGMELPRNYPNANTAQLPQHGHHASPHGVVSPTPFVSQPPFQEQQTPNETMMGMAHSATAMPRADSNNMKYSAAHGNTIISPGHPPLPGEQQQVTSTVQASSHIEKAPQNVQPPTVQSVVLQERKRSTPSFPKFGLQQQKQVISEAPAEMAEFAESVLPDGFFQHLEKEVASPVDPSSSLFPHREIVRPPIHQGETSQQGPPQEQGSIFSNPPMFATTNMSNQTTAPPPSNYPEQQQQSSSSTSAMQDFLSLQAEFEAALEANPSLTTTPNLNTNATGGGGPTPPLLSGVPGLPRSTRVNKKRKYDEEEDNDNPEDAKASGRPPMETISFQQFVQPNQEGREQSTLMASSSGSSAGTTATAIKGNESGAGAVWNQIQQRKREDEKQGKGAEEVQKGTTATTPNFKHEVNELLSDVLLHVQTVSNPSLSCFYAGGGGVGVGGNGPGSRRSFRIPANDAILNDGKAWTDPPPISPTLSSNPALSHQQIASLPQFSNNVIAMSSQIGGVPASHQPPPPIPQVQAWQEGPPTMFSSSSPQHFPSFQQHNTAPSSYHGGEGGLPHQSTMMSDDLARTNASSFRRQQENLPSSPSSLSSTEYPVVQQAGAMNDGSQSFFPQQQKSGEYGAAHPQQPGYSTSMTGNSFPAGQKFPPSQQQGSPSPPSAWPASQQGQQTPIQDFTHQGATENQPLASTSRHPWDQPYNIAASSNDQAMTMNSAPGSSSYTPAPHSAPLVSQASHEQALLHQQHQPGFSSGQYFAPPQMPAQARGDQSTTRGPAGFQANPPGTSYASASAHMQPQVLPNQPHHTGHPSAMAYQPMTGMPSSNYLASDVRHPAFAPPPPAMVERSKREEREKEIDSWCENILNNF